MTEIKTPWTEGPWHVSAYEGGWTCVRDAHGAAIIKISLNNEANAHLIAAAPELVAALQHAEDVMSNSPATFEHDLPIIRAALAKAHGDTQ